MSSFLMPGTGNTRLIAEVTGSAASTAAFSCLYAKKQVSDRDTYSTEMEFNMQGTLNLIGTHSNGHSVNLTTNYGGIVSPAAGVISSNIGNWEWRFVVCDGATVQVWYKPDSVEASWTTFNATPQAATVGNIFDILFGGNARGEGFNGNMDGMRAWKAVKNVANMNAEIVSPFAVDTADLVFSKSAMDAANFEAARTSGVGTMTVDGTVLIDPDTPSTYVSGTKPLITGIPRVGEILTVTGGPEDSNSLIWLPRMNGGLNNLNGWLQ